MNKKDIFEIILLELLMSAGLICLYFQKGSVIYQNIVPVILIPILMIVSIFIGIWIGKHEGGKNG